MRASSPSPSVSAGPVNRLAYAVSAAVTDAASRPISVRPVLTLFPPFVVTWVPNRDAPQRGGCSRLKGRPGFSRSALRLLGAHPRFDSFGYLTITPRLFDANEEV